MNGQNRAAFFYKNEPGLEQQILDSRLAVAGFLLEAEMRERFVRFSHTMDFVAFFHRAAAAFSRFHQLTAEALWHRFFAALVSSFTQPTHGQSHTTDWANFDRHLVVCTTDATGFHLNQRLGVVDCGNKNFERIFARFCCDVLESTVDDVFCNRFLTGQHQHVYKFSDISVAEFWIWQNFALGYFTTTWHINSFQSSVERAFFAHSRTTIIVFHLLDQMRSTTFT